MNRTLKLTVVAGAVALLGTLPLSQAQGQGRGFTVDATLAKLGKTTFANKGCVTCHSIGQGRRAGPDLLGVTDRRDHDWIKKWLHDPATMLQSDSISQAMLAEAKGVKMPNVKLTDREIDALIHYMAQETAKKKGG
jgi:cbb3-type cytochrome oxidase cytochrome c subunit